MYSPPETVSIRIVLQRSSTADAGFSRKTTKSLRAHKNVPINSNGQLVVQIVGTDLVPGTRAAHIYMHYIIPSPVVLNVNPTNETLTWAPNAIACALRKAFLVCLH